ncbi:DUF4167 domain-containing protein [Kordiimonas gwangyangensis]|uniref:DUF4167 domain-containing protein n=1 Tax=Kordiimonas gwangyangensis TaxID=288022 RepID=UPI0003724BA3|nr:DUF4167 domain-containing protein [Kordiimonas gwangyangensis]
MKQAQNARKQRGRSPARKGGGKPGGQGNARNEPKVRGNPKQLLEKYKNQAREAKQAGDRVMAEYYYQFADHYQRVLNDMRGPNSYVESDDDDYEIDGNRDGNQEARGEGRGNDNRGEGRDGRGEGRGENRRGRNRGGRQGGRDNDDAPADANSAQESDGESNEERPRRGRGRNPRRGAEAAVDPAKSEQPVEVHPELDLDGTVAAPEGGSDDEKPKRRRATSATPRKRTPRAKKDVDGAEASDAPSPEDNAAA